MKQYLPATFPSRNSALAGALLFAVVMFLPSGHQPFLAFASEFDESDEREEDEDEQEELEEDASARELLRELEEELKERQRDLLDPNEEKSLIEAAIRQLDKEISLLRNAARLEQQLEKAENDGDDDKLERLEEQLEIAVERFEHMRHVGEVEAGVRELKCELQEARLENEQRALQLPGIIKRQGELLALVKNLHTIYEDGPEALEESLEIGVEMLERLVYLKRQLLELQSERRENPRQGDATREKQVAELVKLHEEFLAIGKQLMVAYQSDDEGKAELLEEKIEAIEIRLEPKWEVFELELELEEAREEGDDETVRELELELKALRAEKIVPPSSADSQSSSKPIPVRIADADLAAVAKMDFQRDVFPILKTHCVRCHGNEIQDGDLDLEKVAAELPLVRNARLWTSVARHVKNRVMPPADETQPSDAERRTMAAWLLGEIQNFDYSGIKDPGYEPARRLTHREYSNTVRDLFGIPLQVTDKFPTDLSGTSGFDNSVSTLFIQPLLLEHYIAAADDVVRQALPEKTSTREQRESLQRVFVASGDSEESEHEAATKILSRYLSRAYRRPATSREIAWALAQFQAAREEGVGFEASIKNVIRTSLISPKFLMKSESPRSIDQAYAIDDWELASRLSYFLWASMPDDELFRLASDSQLSDPAVLTAQVSRMLVDPRADTLGTIFASQWLGFQHLGTRVRADPIDNPWCTESLMGAMKAESAMFFTSLIRDNRPLQSLVNAKYTFLNEELAKHYRLPGVKGKEMRRVALTTANRGGIFTQGSLLAVTSFPGRTSPVVRGKWILEDVLGTPPPPPPPNVSEFSDAIEERDSLTRRQKLELHRRNPNCHACHSQIDPLGFSLENYDWFGRFRTRSGRRTIDASGQLPDGTEFSGPAGLKKVVVEKRMDDFVRQITRKMLSYALGRRLEYYDEAAVRQIIHAVQNDDYQFQTMIHRIVQSYPFRYKKNR